MIFIKIKIWYEEVDLDSVRSESKENNTEGSIDSYDGL